MTVAVCITTGRCENDDIMTLPDRGGDFIRDEGMRRQRERAGDHELLHEDNGPRRLWTVL